jgi:general stress protein 26
MDKDLQERLMALIDQTHDIVVCSVDENGFPNAKAMFKNKHDGMKTFWFSTNTSSTRAQQFQKNDKACIYFLSKDKIEGLMLAGTMEVLFDHDTKAWLWQDGDIQYYSQGIDDPDYCVYKFTADQGNYWYQQKYKFDVE